MKLSAQVLAQALGWHAIGEALMHSVGTDSRAIVPGQCFVALRGERFDGHDYVGAAFEPGATVAWVDHAWWQAHSAPASGALLVVPDTRLALGQFASWWRAQFNLPVIGITGSNGKTSVKEMCAAILRQAFGPEAVLATPGNLNNDIGLPLTLLSLRAQHRAAVVEMGMNHPGEIAYLTRLACPSVALVNNAQRAHLEGMGDLKAVAQEKGRIFEGLLNDGVAIWNADDAFASLWAIQAGARQHLSFGLEHGDVRVCSQLSDEKVALTLVAQGEQLPFSLSAPGQHNLRNAAGAAAACLAAGVAVQTVVQGLSAYAGVKGRLQKFAGQGGAWVLDDTYNANPDSMRAGIDVLSQTMGTKIFVMGDMGEVGQTSAQLHDEIGGYAKSCGVDQLFALGAMSAVAAHNFGEGGQHFSDEKALVKALLPHMKANTTVLVKGSRFMRMERVVQLITAGAQPGEG